MIAALDRGPDHIKAADFAGGRQAALRGLKVHANTISHARLVALEETFPRTRKAIGEEEFNTVSRSFIETAPAREATHTQIGAAFPEHLEDAGVDPEPIALARFEWLWLEAYHAPEAIPLSLADLAGLDEPALLAIAVALHPAARIAPGETAPLLENQALEGTHAILITRPEADVLIHPGCITLARQSAMLGKTRTIGNLLDAGDEPGGKGALEALMHLINAGALTRPQEEPGPC